MKTEPDSTRATPLPEASTSPKAPGASAKKERADAPRSGTPTVHAIIIHHRGREMLGICLETLLSSQRIDLQTVVVSNNCQEDMPELVDTRDDVHVAATGRPIGFSEANNFGVKWAKEHLGPADFYYFLNNDTESRPDTLWRMVEAVDARPKAAAAGPLTLIQAFPDHLNSLGINVTGDAWGWDEGIGQALEDYGPLPDVRPVLTVTGSAYLLAAEVYDQVGGWTEAYEWYFEDIDLGIKIWKAGFEVIHVPQSEILHRVSATMTVGADRKKYFFWRNRLLLALIHWPRPLLWKLVKRALYWEILRVPRHHTELQRRAMRGLLPLLPKALKLRSRLRGDSSWTHFLRPPGSVPVIRLPMVSDPDDDAGVQRDPLEGVTVETDYPVAERDAYIPDAGHPWAAAARLRDLSDQAAPRVLVIGWGPLPFEDQRMNYAPGARSWHFAKALADAGHTVCLAYARIPGSYFGTPPELLTWAEPETNLRIYQMGLPTFLHVGALEGLIREFDPVAVIGAAPMPSKRVTEVAGERPVWLDLFGDPMSEAQAKDGAQPDGETGDHLTAYWQLMHVLLRRGDRFSAVSDRQRCAVIGQLGIFGRLNRATAGEDLVHSVPCAVEPSGPEAPAGTLPEPAVLPELPTGFDDAYMVLWSGGFNTWCDVDTLMDGLEKAMAQNDRLRFVATGGAIKGHDPITFNTLQNRLANSPMAERFALLGCLPKEQADHLQAQADLLVVTERPLYERELGSSGRLLGWLAAGRRCLCTEQSELGAIVRREGLGLTYRTGDGESLAEQILWAADHPEAVDARAEAAARYVAETFSFSRTAEPLVQWVEETAQRAGDLVLVEDEHSYRALASRMDRADLAEDRLHSFFASPTYEILARVKRLIPFADRLIGR